MSQRHADVFAMAPMHTIKDAQAMAAAGVDPDRTQPRERAIAALCGHGRTANQMGYCDRPECYVAPDLVRRVAS